MITVLALYNSGQQSAPTQEKLSQLENRFKTDRWEFNCYSRDISLITHHDPIDYPCHQYGNWTEKFHDQKIAKAIRTHFDKVIDRTFYHKLGLAMMEYPHHDEEFSEFCENYNAMVDSIGQVAAMPNGVETHSPVVYNYGWELEFQHDPWRYFKILKNNEVERKQKGVKTTGGNGLREPINSSNILFCKSRDTIDTHCIAHYHALYTLTRPIVAENCFRYQLQPSFNTINSFRWKNLIDLLIEHLGIQIVTYDEFEKFEEQYWNEKTVIVNQAEYK